MLDIEYQISNRTDELFGEISNGYSIVSSKMKGIQTSNYTPSSKEQTSILNFIIALDNNYGLESLGYNFIYEYFIFQLDYWDNLETQFGKTIPLTWMIGPKALSRWEMRLERDLYHANISANKYGIHIGMFQKQKKLVVVDLDETEESFKKKFHNTEDGFGECLETTTLYNHKSMLCMTCNFKEECKKVLKSDYGKIYVLRGYMKNEKVRVK